MLVLLAGLLLLTLLGGCGEVEKKPIGLAVEYVNHAACAYVAQDKDWFREEGLKISSYESYVTGMALASALARGDIQVAYICLIPAITAYANGKVPLKIVAGTHKYGYGLVVNSAKIRSVKDLERPGIRLGCCREGSPVDVLLHRTIDKYALDPSRILSKVQRMNPPKQVLAIKMRQLDAAFLPEQWATLAEGFGFKMLLTTQDLWPNMQGSVLVVKEELIKKHPKIVEKLIKVTQKATDWIKKHPDKAADILAREFSAVGRKAFPLKAAEVAVKLRNNPQIFLRSMSRLKYTTAIDPNMIQQEIDYLAELGYIKSSFKAEDVLDLRFLR